MDSNPQFHTVSLPFLAKSLDNERYKHAKNDYRHQTAREKGINAGNIAKARKNFESHKLNFTLKYPANDNVYFRIKKYLQNNIDHFFCKENLKNEYS